MCACFKDHCSLLSSWLSLSARSLWAFNCIQLFTPRFRKDLELRLAARAQPKAMEPWREAVAEPSALPPPNLSVPSVGLALEWVHGYRAQDARGNLRYVGGGSGSGGGGGTGGGSASASSAGAGGGSAFVYPAAQVVVRLDPHSWQQRFMTDHGDQVTCLAVSPDLRLVASAQAGRRPSIVVWDAATLATRQVLTGFHRRAVTKVAWSPDSRLLASVGCDEDHSLAVHDWRDGGLLAHARTSKRKVFDLAFGADRIVTCGVKNIGFWQLYRGGRHLRCARAVLRR